MAAFLAATFGMMALLSLPSRFLPPRLRIPPPIKQALNPFEPLIPQILVPGRHARMHTSQGLVAGIPRSPLVSAFRPNPSLPPPVSKGPGPPPPIPAITHQRASGGHIFDDGRASGLGLFEPEGRRGHEERAHRHHRRQHHGARPNPSLERIWEFFFKRHFVRTAARPVHPHWPGGPGHRGGRAH